MNEEQEEQDLRQMANRAYDLIKSFDGKYQDDLVVAMETLFGWDEDTCLMVINEANAYDAMLWRALMRTPRIRMFGSANVAGYPRPDSVPEGGWVHFGAEFWSRFNGGQEHTQTNEWGYAALRAVAIDILRQEGIDLP
jgi:hypothetical protein